MLGTPAWHIDPVFESGGMVKAAEVSTGSALTGNFKESGFYNDMQYPATFWSNIESGCKSSSLFTVSSQGATEQVHHFSSTPVSTTTGAPLNLNFMDDFLSYSQLSTEGGAPYGNMFRADNESAQTPSGITARSSGGADQGLGGIMEQWNASTAFRNDSPPVPKTHGAPVCGLGQPFDHTGQELGRLASGDLRQVLGKSVMPPSRLLPVTSVVSTQQISNLPPMSSSWGQPMPEMSNPCLTHMGFASFVSSKVDVKEVLNQREAYFGAQHMQTTSHQHTMSMKGLMGETRQELVGAQACLDSSEFKYSGHTGKISNSRNGNAVHLVDNLPGRLDLKRPKLQLDHMSEASTVVSVEGRVLQPHRVRPLSGEAFTIDGSPVWLPRTEQQENSVHSIPGRSHKPAGNSFHNVAIPMDLITSQATGMSYQSAGSCKPPANVLRQRKLQKLAPLLKPQGELLGEMQMAHLAAGSQNILRRTTALHWSPKDAMKAEDHVVRERRRRDVMNTRFQTLESLLPKPICRRDRYGIVEDAMVYVKEMERELTHLKMKAASTKQRLDQHMALRQRQLQHIQEQPLTSDSHITVASAGLLVNFGQTNGVPRATWSGNMIQDLGAMPQDSKVEVIVHSKQQHVAIVIECRSGCGGRLFSGVLRVMEKLDLEVTQFSVTKCEEFFLCNAACKPQGPMRMSHEQILQQLVILLRSYLTVM